jgi:DNA polymerase
MTINHSQNLSLFRDTARGCVACRTSGLVHYDSELGWCRPLFDDGATCPSQVIVVAEAPNWDDTYNPTKGRLTYDIETDPTGNFTRDLFASVGLAPSDVLFTNSVLCLPALVLSKDGKKKYPVYSPQMRNCSKWLQMAIDCCNAKVVVTLGGKALDAVNKLSGHPHLLQISVGKAHPWNNRLLFPLYHPSRLGCITRSRDQQIADIQPLKDILSTFR